MSKDIRSFFQVLSKKSGDKQQKHKKKAVIIDSDEDDIIIDTPEKRGLKKKSNRRAQVLSSDSEDESTSEKSRSPPKKHKKIEEQPKLKPINLDVFNKPIKQSKVEQAQIQPDTSKNIDINSSKGKEIKEKNSKKKRKKKNTEIGIHGDKDFEKTLAELDADSDDTILLDNLDFLDKTIEEAGVTNQQKEPTTQKRDKEIPKESPNQKDTPKKAEKRLRKISESTPTPKKRQKLEHTDSGIDPDHEKQEKKRYSAGLYQAYLHRPEPKHRGQKVYPKGKPNCLSGFIFLRTGVLDSLDGEEFLKLVSDHGGKVVHSVSKKVNYIVVGDEPGPAKLEKARNYRIPDLSEDQFLDMILVKSGLKPKYAVKNDSEDFGLGGSENGSDDLMDINFLKEDGSEVLLESKEAEKKEASHSKPKKELDSKFDAKKLSEPDEEMKTECNENNGSDGGLNSGFIKKEFVQEQKSTGTVCVENLSWAEKYKPSSMKEIIGQQDANSNMNLLKRWLENWFKNQEPERRAKIRKPSPFKPDLVGDYYKAALLSGPPGVGKTTTATLVAKELGFDIVEFNASDTRNKKLLREEISQMMKSKTVAAFASGEQNINQKRVLIMDEVDGMAGNQDRGGIAELISFIKSANFPIICMCNDRDHQKMRTLVNYCFPLKFGRANVNHIRGAMLSICFKEGIKIKPDALARLIIGTRCDIRQTLNHMAMWSAAEKEVSLDVIQKESNNSQKDVVMGPWDVIRTVFTKSANKDMTLADREKLFFYDYSLGPLYVQENYLYVKPDYMGSKAPDMEEYKSDELLRLYLTADSLSRSDMIESKIRSTNNWSLLEAQAFHSTVMPSYYASGTMHKCNFPGWFGQNSKRTKRMRLVNELYSHARTRISGDKNSVNLDYAESLRNLVLKPLRDKGTAGVADTLEVMKNYYLLRDDLFNLFELLHRFENPNMYEPIPASVKVALTKLYNKKMVVSFAPPVASKKSKGSEGNEQLPLEGEEEEGFSDDEETEENIEEDTLIKVKNKEPTGKQDTKTKGKTTRQGTQPKGKTSKPREGKALTEKGKK